MQEVSLADDRDAIEDLRKTIPEERRRENDELREILNLTAEVKEQPSYIREKFNRSVQRVSEQHRRQISKERSEFNKKENEKREQFKGLSKERKKDFQKSKNSREESKEFYENEDQARRNL